MLTSSRKVLDIMGFAPHRLDHIQHCLWGVGGQAKTKKAEVNFLGSWQCKALCALPPLSLQFPIRRAFACASSCSDSMPWLRQVMSCASSLKKLAPPELSLPPAAGGNSASGASGCGSGALAPSALLTLSKKGPSGAPAEACHSHSPRKSQRLQHSAQGWKLSP